MEATSITDKISTISERKNDLVTRLIVTVKPINHKEKTVNMVKKGNRIKKI